MARLHRALAALTLASAVSLPLFASAAPRFFRLRSTVTMSGPVTGWDYLGFDAARGYLFVDRRAQGVTVFDTNRGKVVAQITDSAGANSTVIVPGLDRGFTTNRDGSATIFELSTLKTLRRISFGKSADAGFFEPATDQMMFTMGDEHALAFVDARSGKVETILAMNSAELEAAAADGKGNLFVNERDRDAVARIDAHTHRVTAEWPTGACHQPVGMAYDAARNRVLSGCRGVNPVLAVIDAQTGHLIAMPQIGRGNDSVIFDAQAQRVFTSNGVDGNLVVIGATPAGGYVLDQAVTTRPGARTMAFDPRTRRLFLVTAEGAVDPAKKVLTSVAPFYPNTYFPDSLTVLTYEQK